MNSSFDAIGHRPGRVRGIDPTVHECSAAVAKTRKRRRWEYRADMQRRRKTLDSRNAAAEKQRRAREHAGIEHGWQNGTTYDGNAQTFRMPGNACIDCAWINRGYDSCR